MKCRNLGNWPVGNNSAWWNLQIKCYIYFSRHSRSLYFVSGLFSQEERGQGRGHPLRDEGAEKGHTQRSEKSLIPLEWIKVNNRVLYSSVPGIRSDGRCFDLAHPMSSNSLLLWTTQIGPFMILIWQLDGISLLILIKSALLFSDAR